MDEEMLERLLGMIFLLIVTAGAIGMTIVVTDDCMEAQP